ncbi:MAG: ABC transporter ATP-binding protein [Acidimicrobiales bacterium]
MSDSPAVVLEDVSKSFVGPSGRKTVVDKLSLSIGAAEFFSLLGPSGCGKTTTLRLIAGLEQVDEGRIVLGGRDSTALPAHARNVNTVFQNYALFPHLNVFDNVAYGLRRQQVRGPELRRRVRESLALVHMDGFEFHKTQQLSGGQQQRVALARALVNEPTVLLLDEPLAALDLKLRESMQEELKRLQRELKLTFLFVTHDQAEAFAMSDRVAVMDGGRLVQVGSPEELYLNPANHFVATFVGRANFIPLDLVRGDSSGRVAAKRLDPSAAGSTASDSAVGDALNAGRSVFVRPERLRLRLASEPPATDAPVVAGTVIDRTFAGGVTAIRVRLSPDVDVLVTCDSSSSEVRDVDVGDDAFVTWSAEDATVIG